MVDPHLWGVSVHHFHAKVHVQFPVGDNRLGLHMGTSQKNQRVIVTTGQTYGSGLLLLASKSKGVMRMRHAISVGMGFGKTSFDDAVIKAEEGDVVVIDPGSISQSMAFNVARLKFMEPVSRRQTS